MSQYLQKLMHMTGLRSGSKMQYSDQSSPSKHMDSPLEIHEHIESQPVRESRPDKQTKSIVQKKDKPGHQEPALSQQVSPAVGHEKPDSPDVLPSAKKVMSDTQDRHELAPDAPEPRPAVNDPIINNDITIHQNQPDMSHSHVTNKSVESQAFNKENVFQTEQLEQSHPDINIQQNKISKKSGSGSALTNQDNPDPLQMEKQSKALSQNPTFQEIRAWVAEPLSEQVQPDFSDRLNHPVRYDQAQIKLSDKKLQSISQDKSGSLQSQNFEVQDVQLSIGDIHLTVEAAPEEKTVREPSSRPIRKNPEQSRSGNRLERHYVRF